MTEADSTTTSDSTPSVLILTSDLFFSTRLSSAAMSAGHAVQTIMSASDAMNHAASGEFSIIVVDLEMPGLDLRKLVQQTKSTSTTSVLAFGPHVREDLFENARAAGCDEVLARGAIEGRLRRL